MELTAEPVPQTPSRFNALSDRLLCPLGCRLIFAVVVGLNLWSSWHFLTHRCPIDLAGDEAQYWTWSRHLAAGYYSKGPLVAYLIRASCAVLGDTMPAVRLPAVLLAAGTSFCTYWLTRKLFGSDRLALGAFLLGATVPMFAAGGTLMTIDPPLFFCWAAATCFTAKAIFDGDKGGRWPWIAAGVMAGIGVLAKYAMLLWPPLVLIFLASDPAGRRLLRTPWPWLMSVVTLTFLTPPFVWNAQHGWVTFHHVATQIGGDGTGAGGSLVARLLHGATLAVGRVFETAGIQLAAVNPALSVFVVGGVVFTLARFSATDPNRRALRYLLVIGGGFWTICLLDALKAKVEPNWPAPSYFTLLILTAYFISTRWRGDWKPWRGWFYGAVAFGLIAGFLFRDATVLYPAAAWADRHYPRSPGKDGQPRFRIPPKSFDLATKLRGIESPFATTIGANLQQLRPGAFVLCEDYMDASQLSFYLPGKPDTYFAGSYWTDLAVRRRWTQYDIWDDRRLDQPKLNGKDAIYVGWPNYAPLRQSFDKVTRLPDIVVKIDGITVRTLDRLELQRGSTA